MESRAFRPVPVTGWEWTLIRVFFAVVVVWGLWEELPFEKQEMPNGLARLVDLSFLGGAGAMTWFRPLIVAGALLYAANFFRPLGVLVLTVAHVAYNTLHNSQGFTFHGNNMIGLVLVTQCAAELFWFGYRMLHKRPFSFLAGLNAASYQLYFSQCAVAAVYVTSALTKLSKTDGQWLFKSHLLAKGVVKTHRQQYYDNPTQGTLEPVIAVAQWLAEHHIITRILFGAGFMLELFAFLALWNRAWACFIGLGIIFFHFGVELVMKLDFRVNQILCLIFLVNMPFWIAWFATRSQRGPGAKLHSLTSIRRA